MSNLTIGQAVGVVVGVVVGAYTGGAGWYLAGSILLGASAGYAIGSAIDPAMPDMPSPGQSATGQLDITLASEGVIISDALGTVKATGNIFWYGGSRVVEIKEKVSGGKGGGSKKVTTGYKYYLSWAMGLCIGPVDELLSIYSNNNLVWQGNELRSLSSDGMTTIIIEDVGTLYFYFGTNDHIANTFMGNLILSELGQTYNPSYKNLCWVYFKDCNLGSYNRVPTFKFVFRKSPVLSFNAENRINLYDYNPSHAIYYLLSTGTEISSSMIDETSFSNAADTLLSENRGISIFFGEERTVITYIESIITHINAILQYENDGKFHLTLIRDDVDLVDMPSFSEEDFVEVPIIKRSTWLETNNDIKVQYSKRVEVPFGDEVTSQRESDVYVMGFIDASVITTCLPMSSGVGAYCEGSGVGLNGALTYGPACEKWTYDIFLYFDGATERPKTWLIGDSYHTCALNRVEHGSGYYWPIAPAATTPSLYADIFNSLEAIDDWSTDVSLWQDQFEELINLGRGEFIPGSVLRVYVDNSSLGGVATFEPAYSQFKIWVEETYEGIVFLEYEYDSESWVQMLHEPLTPWGYGVLENVAIDINVKEVAADDLANKELLGRTNSKTIRLALFGTDDNANWAAERALRRSSFPFIEGSIKFHHTAFTLKIGDLFKLNSSQYNIIDMVCRVMSINLGDIESEDIEVSFIQDSEYYSEQVILPETEVFPPRISYSLEALTPAYIVDAPYDFIGNNVALLPLVGRKTSTEIGHDLYISHDGGTSYTYLKTYESYCLHATLTEAITEHYPTVTDKIFPITVDFSISSEAENIETITRASLFAGENLAIIFNGNNYGEIIAFQTVTPDDEIDGRVKLTGILRGKYDSQMRNWEVNSDVFFINAAAIEAFNDPSFFPEVTKHFKFVPFNSKYGGQISDAEEIEYTITGRGKAPFPPANLRANDINLDDIGIKPQYTGNIVLTWTPNLRGGGAGIGIPGIVEDIGQTYEGYFLVEVYILGNLVRSTEDIDALTWTYTEAMQLSDYGSLALKVDFYVYNYLVIDGSYYKSEPLIISAYRSGATTTTTTTTSSTTSSTSTTA